MLVYYFCMTMLSFCRFCSTCSWKTKHLDVNTSARLYKPGLFDYFLSHWLYYSFIWPGLFKIRITTLRNWVINSKNSLIGLFSNKALKKVHKPGPTHKLLGLRFEHFVSMSLVMFECLSGLQNMKLSRNLVTNILLSGKFPYYNGPHHLSGQKKIRYLNFFLTG